MTQKLTLLRGVQAINWNRITDEKDLEVWDRLTANFWPDLHSCSWFPVICAVFVLVRAFSCGVSGH